MLTLGTMFAGSAYAMSGGDKKKKEQGPPINASSKEEENFIQYVAHTHSILHSGSLGRGGKQCRGIGSGMDG